MGAVRQKVQTVISAQPQREVRVIHHPHQQPENVKLPVAAYVRVSTNMDDQLNSFAAQLRHYREYISQNDDWELVDIYADEGITGTSTHKRDEFHRLMRDCRKGKIKRVLVKSISRFARNTADCIEAVRELTSLGVSVLFEKEGIDTARMSNELFLAAMSDFAQNESLSMAGNLRRGIRMRMANGTFVPPNPPFGYRWEDGQLAIQADEAATVKWMFEQYLSGTGVERIAILLTKRQIPRKDGDTCWSYSAVRYILGNERYVGDMLFQKSYKSDTLPFRQIENSGQVDRYLVRDCHTPIISREAYERVQALIEQRQWKRQHSGGSQPFSTKVQCGCCKSRFKRKLSGGKAFWSCYRHNCNKTLCDMPRISEAELERIFIRCYNKLKLHYSRILSPMLEQLHALKRRVSLNNPEAVKVNDQILALTKQNAVFAGLAAREIWDNATYQEKKAINDQEIQRLHALRSLFCGDDELDGMIEHSRQVCNVVADGPNRLDGFDADLFAQLIKSITVQSDYTLLIELNNGLTVMESFEKAVR